MKRKFVNTVGIKLDGYPVRLSDLWQVATGVRY